jgi:hypothetical protein
MNNRFFCVLLICLITGYNIIFIFAQKNELVDEVKNYSVVAIPQTTQPNLGDKVKMDLMFVNESNKDIHLNILSAVQNGRRVFSYDMNNYLYSVDGDYLKETQSGFESISVIDTSSTIMIPRGKSILFKNALEVTPFIKSGENTSTSEVISIFDFNLYINKKWVIVPKVVFTLSK